MIFIFAARLSYRFAKKHPSFLDWNLNRKLYLGTILSYFQAIVNHFSQFHHFKQNNRQQSGHYHNFYHKKTIQLPRKHHLSFSSRQRFWWCWQWHPFLQSVSLFWNYVYCFSTIFISNSKKQKNRRNHTNFFGFFQLISRLNSIFHHVFTKASLFLHIKLLIFTYQFLIYS